MTDSNFTKMINKACKMAHEHKQLLNEIDEESVRRYGYFPSEIDCDPIIDAVQYGIAVVEDADEFKRYMIESIKIQTDYLGNVNTI